MLPYLKKQIRGRQSAFGAMRICALLFLLVSMARSQADPAPGTLDGTFNPVLGGYATQVPAIAIQPDGKILLGGDFTKVNGLTQNNLTRLNADGTVDSQFVSLVGADDIVRVILVQKDGRIVVAGGFWTINGASWQGVARLNADGSVDPTFGQFSKANADIVAAAVQADGKIVIGGAFTEVNGVSRNYLARLNTDGSLDATFSAPADYNVRALAVRPDGKILVGGQFTYVANARHPYLVQLNSDGSVDSGFNIDVNYDVYSILLQTNGQTVIGGAFSKVNGTYQNYLARLNTDGSRDATFTANTSGNVYCLALQSDNRILVGGRFSTVNGASRNNIARLNGNGLLDTTFDAGVGPDAKVSGIALQADGKIALCGDFMNVASVGRTYTARLWGDAPAPVTTASMQIWTAAEIGWLSETDVQYQVQWSSEVAPTVWQNLGNPVVGTGANISVFDSTKNQPRKFYRVIKL
jgi:uncharacterized delta-60 repeat protein